MYTWCGVYMLWCGVVVYMLWCGVVLCGASLACGKPLHVQIQNVSVCAFKTHIPCAPGKRAHVHLRLSLVLSVFLALSLFFLSVLLSFFSSLLLPSLPFPSPLFSSPLLSSPLLISVLKILISLLQILVASSLLEGVPQVRLSLFPREYSTFCSKGCTSPMEKGEPPGWHP